MVYFISYKVIFINKKEMAKKRRAKRAHKSQGVTINWGVVGLIVVIALLIGLWQMSDKSDAQSDAANLPKMITNLSADVRLNGELNMAWRLIPPSAVSGLEVIAWKAVVMPRGAVTSTNFDIALSEVGSTTLQGDTKPWYYATVDMPPLVLATSGTVELMPVVKSPAYPNGRDSAPSGAKTNVVLTY